MNRIEELKILWNTQADKFNQWDDLGLDEIVAFAQEVEREECAKTCESVDTEYDGEDVLATWCADAIRKRGAAE